jgi:hypothetical protein
MKNDHASRVTRHSPLSTVLGLPSLSLAWFCFLIHALALGAMLFVIQPGLLVGTEASRREFIAAHAVAWQIGWLIWMPASLALVLLFLAWADSLEFKVWGIVAVALCFAGAIVDWLDETMLVGLVPSLAAHAATDAFAASLFSWWERYYLVASLGLANGLYSIGGLSLSVLAFKTRGFPRWLAWLSSATWIASLAIIFLGLLGDRGGIFVTSVAAFALFMPWMLVLGYGWLRKEQSR